MDRPVCSVERCDNRPVARGLCWKHYKRLKRHGDARIALRRYKLPHECRHCGTTDASAFLPAYRGICKSCLKVMAVRRATLVAQE